MSRGAHRTGGARRETLGARRLLGIGLAAMLLVPLPALALRLPGRDAADRNAARPLRELSLLDVLSGRPVPGAWVEADEKLPSRCKSDQALSAEPCDDELRCAWLAARASVARAFTGKVVRGKLEAAARLHRAASRMALGGECGRGAARRALWREDRRKAELDDARVQLVLLNAIRQQTQAPLLTGPAAGRVEGLMRTAAEGGVAAVEETSLRATREDLATAVRRGSWLLAHPALVDLRRTLAELWQPVGAVPKGCGDELYRPDLLDDQWRGYLVREVAPRAFSCVSERLPEALAKVGLTPADARTGKLIAEGLASVASRDPGGRSFARDKALAGRFAELRQAFAPRRAARQARPAAAESATRSARRGTAPKAAPASPRSSRRSAKQPPADAGGKAASTRSATSSRAKKDGELVRLAARVGVITGEEASLVRDARRVRSPKQREQLLRRLVVGLHRAVCAPLEAEEPADLDASRRILAELGQPLDERACTASEGRDDIESLLAAAPGLERLRSACALRRAARLIVSRQPVLARHALDRVDERLRGTTWTLLYAWAAREEGDPVTADRVLARLDDETLDRLRATGQEEMAQVVAHAWVSRAP